MCGHGVIGLVMVALENGILPIAEPETIVRLETPSGLVRARAFVERGRVRSVAFTNVPSFVVALDQVVQVPGVGAVPYDLAFGGAFYAFCDAAEFGVELKPAEARRLIALGMAIKEVVSASRSVNHPVEPELAYLYGTIFVGPSQTPGVHSRQVCVFADGALDRSPTGTGVSARLALLAARGELEERRPYVVESLLGTRFTGRILERLTYAGVRAVIPEVEGSAYLTGRHEFLIDPADPLRTGFLLR
jgi:trans-L-3-hydroxyproline dehydratase